MRRLRVPLVLAASLVLVTASLVSAAPGPKQSADSGYTGPNVDTSVALVQLNGDPLSTYVKTKPSHGKKIDFNNATVKSYRAQLSALRNDFKQWLQANAPKAKITGSWDLALNAVSVQLNGTALSLLATAPQVTHVEYDGLYHPDVVPTDPDLALIHAQQAWAQGGGGSNAGAGIRVAIVDTGIDINHPCFDDTGYAAPSGFPRGDLSFTNNKVIVAKVFNMKTPSRGYTPEAIQDHGTHVAGTVACDYLTPIVIDGVTIPYSMSGVAPKAFLGNYNIFPGDVVNAHSEDILNALTAAYEDGMDVANMSLGGGASGIKDLLSMAVDDLDQANMVIAVAAGNSGQGNAVPPHLLAAGHYTIESPGSAARALTAGASTVGHFLGVNVTDDTDPATYAAAIGAFGPTADATGALSANLGTYCTGGGAGSLTGKIALINRGTCAFSVKIRNAQTAGAVGAIIVNNVYGPPVSMASDGTANQPTIPGVQVSKGDQSALNGSTGDTFTIHHALAYVADPSQSNYMAGFSSEGPTDVDYRVKPDVVAPGVNVLSSIPLSFCSASTNPDGCFAFFQGTSMATPHLAGSAAVVKWLHPTWDAWQIRSAIVNTATENVLKDAVTGTASTDVNVTGAGLEDLSAAVNAFATIDPVSISFGAVPSGAGTSMSFPVHITNVQGVDYTYSLSVDPGTGGVHFGLSVSSIHVNAGQTGTFWVTMTSDKGAVLGDHSAMLDISGTAGYLHAVVYTFVKN